jgi:hypothetical protein
MAVVAPSTSRQRRTGSSLPTLALAALPFLVKGASTRLTPGSSSSTEVTITSRMTVPDRSALTRS